MREAPPVIVRTEPNEAGSAERTISYVEAGVEALREEMRRDETIFCMGQGIGPRGGNWQQTRGLWAEFGEERLRDTPISELGQTGIGIGAALAGSRPIVDIVFFDFILEASGQLIQQAAIIHYISNGKFKVPLVVRSAMGGVRSSGPHHSHTFYSLFMHMPGLKVVIPATPYDVKGLLKTSIRDDNPVLFIEHKALYNSKGAVPTEEYLIPFGQAAIRRPGTDVTLVAVSRMVLQALAAAEILAKKGISVEVIDPRTVVPLDKTTILDSVSRTGRLLVVDEAYATCGFAAEIAALVAEEALDELDAPVRRVCALPAPHAFSPSLNAYLLPSEGRIVEAVVDLLEFSPLGARLEGRVPPRNPLPSSKEDWKS
jgi:pyruvate/2-oxoglutarate/acetoin dehydrogenase E1 component